MIAFATTGDQHAESDVNIDTDRWWVNELPDQTTQAMPVAVTQCPRSDFGAGVINLRFGTWASWAW